MTDRVGVAAVGLGWWGGVLAGKSPAAGLDVRTCWSPTESSRNSFAERFGCTADASLDDVLARDDISGLLVATPHSTHAEIIERAAAAGKHVFVEKPLTLSYAEGLRAVEAARDAGIVLQVGHMRRRQPATRRVKELVASGELGTVLHVEANLSNHKELTPREGWRGDPAESPAGGMTGLGVHMVDNLIYLVGPVARVAAFSRNLRGLGRHDEVTTIALEFESGPLGHIGTATVVPDVARVAAFGTDGSAWAEGDGRQFYLQRIGEPLRTEQPVDTVDAVTDELAEFAACLRGEAEPETGGPEALEVVAVLEAIVRSAETGTVVDMSDVRAPVAAPSS